MALAVIALGIIVVVVVALTPYPALGRSVDNLEQASESAVAVTAILETVADDLATVFSIRSENP